MMRTRLGSALLRGTVAGLAGAAAMHVFRLVWESANRHQREYGVFGFDCEADVRGARWLARGLTGRALGHRSAQRLGLALHYLYGIALGATYAAAETRLNWLSTIHTAPASAVLWLVADEIPVTIAGVSNPLDRRVRSHAGALAAHVVYVATMRQILRLRGRR
jgi:hypothetical protein